MLDITRSLAAAKRLPMIPKGCYSNALLTMATDEEFQDGWYVEGFALPTINGTRIPIEHGWLEVPDGKIIDPSFAVLGHTDVTYFPAIRLRWQRAEKMMLRNIRLPYMLYHKSLTNRAAYANAMVDAYTAAFGEDVAKKLSLTRKTSPK